MTAALMPSPGTIYKLFLVELDDDNRERVLSCKVKNLEFESTPEYDDIQIDDLLDSPKIYRTSTKTTLELELVSSEDGNLFRIEDFLEEDEEE